MSAWKHLREGIATASPPPREAQEQLGSQVPFIEDWIWTTVGAFRRVSKSENGASRAGEGAEFVADILDVFDAESDHFRLELAAERALLTGQGRPPRRSRAPIRVLIAEHPERAAGYCTLSDIYLDAEPPRYEDALGVLRRAADEPPSKIQATGT